MDASIYFFTDCHFEENTIISEDNINSITTIINNDSNENICLAFSGDLAQGGKNKEYESFMLFLELILEKVKKKVSFVCCPGNHDILRSEGEEYPLEELIRDSKNKETIKTRLNALSEYYAFQRAGTKLNKLTDFLYKQIIGVDKSEIVVYSLNNVALTCYGGDYSSDSTYGYAYISEDSINKIKKESSSQTVILLMHYPFSYADTKSQKLFRRIISENVDIVLCGHKHDHENEILLDANRTNSILGSAFHIRYSNESHFYKIDLKNKNYQMFSFNDGLYVQDETYELITNSFNKNKLDISLDDAFVEKISTLKFMNKTYHYNDMYVFPLLSSKKYSSFGLKNDSIKDISHFFDRLNQKDIISILGDEQSGKTSLANYIYLECFHNSYFPILCNGEDLINSENNYQKLIQTKIREQYDNPNRAKSIFEQKCQKSDKVLVIDDYTYGDLQILESALDYFGHIVVVSNAIDSNIPKTIKSVGGSLVAVYYIEQFYKEKRKELYDKVIRYMQKNNDLGNLNIEDLKDRVERFVKSLCLTDSYDAVSLINIVMVACTSADTFDNNYYSSLYQAKSVIFLSETIKRHGERYNTDVVNRVLASQAYAIYKLKKTNFECEEFKQEIKAELDNYNNKLDCKKIIDICSECGIICENSDMSYKFTNRDIFSYYIAEHIHIMIEQDGNKEGLEELFLEDICSPLIFNILMCLASIYKNTTIVKEIIDAIEREANKEKEINKEKFDIHGLEDKQMNKLKRLTKDDVETIIQRESDKEQASREKYIEHKNDYYYYGLIPAEYQPIVIWVNRLKIVCALLNSFKQNLKGNQKTKLFKLSIKLPNIVLKHFNDSFFAELDLVYAYFKTSFEGETKDQVLQRISKMIVDYKRSFVLSTYDIGCRYLSNEVIDEIKAEIEQNNPSDQLTKAQSLMLDSFETNQKEKFINNCMKIISDDTIEDFSFIKMSAKLIGRQFYLRNYEYCSKHKKSFVDKIFDNVAQMEYMKAKFDNK